MDINTTRRGLLKATTGLLGGSIVASLSGCAPPIQNNKQIKMGVSSRPRMLDPRQATDALSSRVNRLIYRQLIDFDEAFKPVPDLASWQQISATHYRLILIDFPEFHHGKPLTAYDVAATYQNVLSPDSGSPHRGSLKGIKKVVAINSQEIDFYLTEIDALFVGRLVIGILPEDLLKLEHRFQDKPIGCGECKFISLSEQRLILQRKDLVELHFVAVRDATIRVLKLKKGELDIVQNDLSPELVKYSDGHESLKVSWHQGTNFSYIGYNFEDELLSQIAVRQAIAYGINRQAVIDAMFSGNARLAGGLLVPEHWAGEPAINGYEYNPEKARELLKQVPNLPDLINSDGRIELSYKTSSDPTRIRLATIYQSQLKRVGIQLNIQSYDWGTFFNDIKQGRFQLFGLAWVGVKSPDIFQYVFDSRAIPPNGANRGRYRDDIADSLIREAAQSQSIARQVELYRKLQRHLQATLATLPLWYEDHYAVMRTNIQNYKLYSDGRLDGLLTAQKKIAPKGDL